MPGSRVVRRASPIGGRMPPAARDPCGPKGRKTHASPCPDFHKSSPHEAGVELACLNYRV